MDDELAEATNMDTIQLRKQLEVGRAARNKLIKVISVLSSTFKNLLIPSSNCMRFQPFPLPLLPVISCCYCFLERQG